MEGVRQVYNPESQSDSYYITPTTLKKLLDYLPKIYGERPITRRISLDVPMSSTRIKIEEAEVTYPVTPSMRYITLYFEAIPLRVGQGIIYYKWSLLHRKDLRIVADIKNL